MAATRKDYEALAAGFRRTRPDGAGHLMLQWRHDVDAVGAALRETGGYDRNGNRRFDTDRFVAACEALKEKA